MTKNVWKTVGLFILISIPAELLALLIAHYFGPKTFISTSILSFFATGNFLGAMFLQKFRTLTANELVQAGVIYIINNILLGILAHSKSMELFVSFFQSLSLVFATYYAMRSTFNPKASGS